MPTDEPLRQRRIHANGVEFALLESGDPSGPLALCLHGFPDSAFTWRRLLPALASVGFHAVAPFQRGYAPTEVPVDGRYQSGVLGVDANALHEVLGADERAVIIGHDWGAPGAYAAVGLAPERWRHLVGMAVPPGEAMAVSFLTNLAQLRRSWYMFFFQSPLADLVVPADDLAFIDTLWRDWSPGHDASTDLPAVKDALRDPANLSAALGYYRATIGAGLKDPELAEAQRLTGTMPTVPTLYLHGADDGCIGVEVAEHAAATAPANVTVRVVERAGHFLHLERTDEVHALVLDAIA